MYVEGRREPSQEALSSVPSPASVTAEAPSADAKKPLVAPNRDGARLREMSQSFRNSTFLIAIRAAGFYCEDVAAAHETGDGIWIARCTDVREYKVSARQSAELSVEPIYFDAPIQNERLQLQLERDLPPQPLEPERPKQ
jgi:hypothetical protein